VYAWQDLQPLGELAGWNTDKIKAIYARQAADLVYPAVNVPPSRPVALDVAFSAVLLALCAAVRKAVSGLRSA
jgi:hypothetical protein